MVGMLGMYLFSMSGSEAIELASADRYTKTILIAIIFLNMVLAVKLISELPEKSVTTAVITVCFFVLFFAGIFISSNPIAAISQNQSATSEYKWIGNASRKYGVQRDSSYCILIPAKNNGYTYYMGRYIFQSNNVTATVIQNEDDFNDISQKYVFIYDQDNEIIQDWIQKVYPDQVGNEVIIQPVEEIQ